MNEQHWDEYGGRTLLERKLDNVTVVYDVDNNMPIIILDQAVVLPIGVTVELTNPNVNATVVGVRLLAGTSNIPMRVRLD